MKKVLVVEDEAHIRELIAINLKRAGYEVVQAQDANSAKEILDKNGDIDIALLDVMLGDGPDGYTISSYIRSKNEKTGIIMLTAKSGEESKMHGFSSGADDYITKPFSPADLIMRVSALYRRVSMANDSKSERGTRKLVVGEFELDEIRHIVTKNGKDLELTSVEYLLMRLFMTNQNTAFSREEILDRVWGKNYLGEYKTVDVNMRRLRMKAEQDPSNPKYLQTIWGYGYKWEQKQ